MGSVRRAAALFVIWLTFLSVLAPLAEAQDGSPIAAASPTSAATPSAATPAAAATPAVASSSAATSATSAEEQLSDLYAPVAYMRQQTQPCAPTPQGGEPYLPLPVEIVLDNPRVTVRDSANGDLILATGVSATDLVQYGPTTYLDFPGDPRNPGCTFERDERARIAELGLKPTTYAHVVFDDEHHRLAVQYWFWYYFNDWNNTHEGDWEMVQVIWDDVPSVEAALTKTPTSTGFAQHDGGETAQWGDPKIQLEDGTHMRVYPAAGSHATFYTAETYLGWGAHGAGFGCDVSAPPSVRTPLDVVVLPDQVDPHGKFSWLLYQGRWGERQPSVFNGPRGPWLSGRWVNPWDTTSNWRTLSIILPGSKALGPTSTSAFCRISLSGSRLLLRAFVHPWLILPTLAVIIGLIWMFYRRSRDLLWRSIRIYREHWSVFSGIGIVAVPIGVAFNIAQAFFVKHYPLLWVVQWFDNTAGANLTAVALVGSVQQIAMLLIIAPAVIQAVADIHKGITPGVARSYKMAAKRWKSIGGCALAVLVFAGVPALIVIGIPISIWLLVRWQFFTHALIFDEATTVGGALEASARLTRRRWWKVLFVSFIFDLIAATPGVVVGFGLLTLGGTAVGFANSISSLLYSLTIPIAVIAISLLYLRLRGDATFAPVEPESKQKKAATTPGVEIQGSPAN